MLVLATKQAEEPAKSSEDINLPEGVEGVGEFLAIIFFKVYLMR